MALYSDVDGTLLGHSGDISDGTVQEIRRFVEAGHGFTLATGRSLPAVRRLMQKIPVNMPVVLCNGAYVYDPITNRSLWNAIERQVVQQIFPLVHPIPDTRVYIECSDTSLWSTDSASLQDPYIITEGLRLECFDSIEEVLERGEVLKMGIKWVGPAHQCPDECFSNIKGRLDEAFSTSVSCCLSSADYFEIMPRGITKWTGIALSQSMSGQEPRVVTTVGDQHNDLEMIQHADLGVAMANAVDAVKRVARLRIGHVDAHPIGQLLRDIRTGKIPFDTPKLGRGVRLANLPSNPDHVADV